MKILKELLTYFLLLSLNACAPEIGSESWRDNLKQKPKGEWTINKAKDYTRHCLFK
jgi:hypothetical protein